MHARMLVSSQPGYVWKLSNAMVCIYLTFTIIFYLAIRGKCGGSRQSGVIVMCTIPGQPGQASEAVLSTLWVDSFTVVPRSSF